MKYLLMIAIASFIALSNVSASHAVGEQKGTPPVARAAGHYDPFQPAETFVHSAKWSQVRSWPEAADPACLLDVRSSGVKPTQYAQTEFFGL